MKTKDTKTTTKTTATATTTSTRKGASLKPKRPVRTKAMKQLSAIAKKQSAVSLKPQVLDSDHDQSQSLANAGQPISIRVGPRTGPHVCTLCGSDVKSIYRITSGYAGYRVAHLDEAGVVQGWECPNKDKSPLAKYLNAGKGRPMSDEVKDRLLVTKAGKSKTLHLARLTTEEAGWVHETHDELGRVMVTECGAIAGTTTRDRDQVSCKNCRRQFKTKETTTMTTTMTKEQVTEKIKAHQANKAAAGKAASLVGKKGDKAAEKGAKKLTGAAAKAKANAKPKAETKMKPCGCGCGENVKKRFAMGHDARFHGWLKRVGDGRMKLSELPKQVRQGMFAGASENEKGVKPKVKEEHYLAGLAGE